MGIISGRFSNFSSPCYFSRVDNIHPLEIHIGLDEKSHKTIELRAKHIKPRKVSGTNVIEVKQFQNQEYYTIRFSLIDEELDDVFIMFCEDLVENTRTLEPGVTGYKAVVERYYKWRKMFLANKKNFLSESKIMGLIGEILFLKGNLADRIGLSAALKSWSGQELTHKDFSHEEMWFEVKAISRSSMSVKISSLEQLESEIDGELVVHSFEKMSEAYDGITLNKLVFDTVDMFATLEEKDDFLAKVCLQGYEYNKYYDSFVYELVAFHRFLVTKDFPKLTRSNVNSAVSKATYTLSLVDITGFEIKD